MTDRNSKAESTRIGTSECPGCRENDEDETGEKKPHIQDLCPADREKIAQLVKKLTECTQARHKAEAELAEIRSEHESLINRCDLHCNEYEEERNILKQQLATATSRERTSKLESAKSLSLLGEQLDAQEKEFEKLTETMRDLLREKIQLQNALIERESRVRIAESKLERAKESFEMEKLLFIKEHARDSILRKGRDRGTQTSDMMSDSAKQTERRVTKVRDNSSRVKSKDDLEDLSGDGILLRSLFFATATPYEDEPFVSHDLLNSPIK